MHFLFGSKVREETRRERVGILVGVVVGIIIFMLLVALPALIDFFEKNPLRP